MEHWVVIKYWASDYELGVDVVGIAHSFEEAKKTFADEVAKERPNAIEEGYRVYGDGEGIFDAGEEGYYSKEHICIEIKHVAG